MEFSEGKSETIFMAEFLVFFIMNFMKWKLIGNYDLPKKLNFESVLLPKFRGKMFFDLFLRIFPAFGG